MSDTEPVDAGLLDHLFDEEAWRRATYTESDLGVLVRVLSHACPKCGATAGNWCRTKGGRTLEHLDLQHLARRGVPVYHSARPAWVDPDED